jgi:hypothetical protein
MLSPPEAPPTPSTRRRRLDARHVRLLFQPSPPVSLFAPCCRVAGKAGCLHNFLFCEGADRAAPLRAVGSGTTRTLARPACHARPPRVAGGFLSIAGVLSAPNSACAFAVAVGNARKRGSRRPDTCFATPTLARTTRGPPKRPQQLRGSMSGRPPSADLICGASGGRSVAKRLCIVGRRITWHTTRSLVITSPLHTGAGASRGA